MERYSKVVSYCIFFRYFPFNAVRDSLLFGSLSDGSSYTIAYFFFPYYHKTSRIMHSNRWNDQL